ncbi:FAST kinase domain-containing protein 5, mitochondrial [Mugil cephalus]|uniref:FAST kinase domain-containing protein 5, mitochondrial n=1 Tax=Mugil cephalus TaxID=48193 RepID=UPI001FB74FF3|nr:FAST kinase domain-containing protein 5, mitochondrial [Mugil cephalus]
MAASVLCRRVPRLRYLPCLRTAFAQDHRMHVIPNTATDDQEEKKKELQPQEAIFPEGYNLHYNPSSYHHSACNSEVSRSQAEDDEDEQCSPAYAPSFWQQSNRYSVSCSRHLSSSKNTLLDLAYDKCAEPAVCSVSPHEKDPIPPYAQVDSRAFYNCRPEYASVSLNLTERPHPVKWEEAIMLLKKVNVLKGNMKPSDVSRFFVELSRLDPNQVTLLQSDPRFIMLLRYSARHLHLFTELELMKTLQSFVWLDVPPVHPVLELYEAELIRRVDQMSLHQLLFAADLCRCIGKRVPQFLQHLYDLVRLHLRQVRVHELVQLLYIIGEGRHCPKELIRPLEQLLMHHLQELHPEEVGTVCLGLFKSQTSISKVSVTHIIDKALSCVNEMSDLALVNVMKYLRFSHLYHKAWLEAMAQEVPLRAHRMGVKGLMHVALACSALHYRNDGILTAIAERVPLLAPHCRCKDSGKLLWAYGTLRFQSTESPSFYSSLTQSMRQRKTQFRRSPEHLLTGLIGLAFVSLFPEDLIAFALSTDFVNLAMKQTQELKKDLFTLDETVALEVPEWNGPRLSSEIREEVAEMLWKFAQSDVCLKPEVLEAESCLQDLLGGESFVWKRMIMPHTRSIDLEIHLDHTGQPIPVNQNSPEQTASTSPSDQGWGKLNVGVSITDELLARMMNKNPTTSPSTPFSVKPRSHHRLQSNGFVRLFDTDLTSEITKTLIKPRDTVSAHQDNEGIIKIAVQVPNRNHYCLQSDQLLGLHAMKRRQLQMAGFRVVELDNKEWFPLLKKGRIEKLAYLHYKIYDSL